MNMAVDSDQAVTGEVLLKEIKLSPNPVDISDIKKELSAEFLSGLFEGEEPANTIVIMNDEVLVGCFMKDATIPDDITDGNIMNANVIKAEAEEILGGYARLRIATRNQISGYSFISPILFADIQSALNLSPEKDTVEAPDEDQETPKPEVNDIAEPQPELADAPAPAVDDVIEESPVVAPDVGSRDSYEFILVGDNLKRPWKLTLNGEERYLGEKTKELLEVLLQTDLPLSKKQIENDYGVDAGQYALTSLEKTGLLRKYRRGTSIAIHYMAFSDQHPKPVSHKYDEYVSKPKAAPAILTEDMLADMGVGRGEKGHSGIFNRSNLMADDEPAFSPDEFSRPERNPDPSLVDVPYINAPEDSQLFQMALDKFNAGNMSDFERATKVIPKTEDTPAQILTGQGRWVYVGTEEYGEESLEDLSTYRAHPRTSDMLMNVASPTRTPA